MEKCNNFRKVTPSSWDMIFWFYLNCKCSRIFHYFTLHCLKLGRKNISKLRDFEPIFLSMIRHTKNPLCLKMTEKSHLTLRAKRATFTCWLVKSLSKMPKIVYFVEFLKNLPKAFGQIVLPDSSLLMGQKLVENSKMLKIQMLHSWWFSNIVRMMTLTAKTWISRLFSMLSKSAGNFKSTDKQKTQKNNLK